MSLAGQKLRFKAAQRPFVIVRSTLVSRPSKSGPAWLLSAISRLMQCSEKAQGRVVTTGSDQIRAYGRESRLGRRLCRFTDDDERRPVFRFDQIGLLRMIDHCQHGLPQRFVAANAQLSHGAGGRSLLVSHWEVETNSAVALMTGTFAALQAAASSLDDQALAPRINSAGSRFLKQSPPCPPS
jgi:hypothetical protein